MKDGRAGGVSSPQVRYLGRRLCMCIIRFPRSRSVRGTFDGLLDGTDLAFGGGQDIRPVETERIVYVAESYRATRAPGSSFWLPLLLDRSSSKVHNPVY